MSISIQQAPVIADAVREETPRLKIAVGIATAGRPAVLSKMLAKLRSQSRAPDIIIISAPGKSDVADSQHYQTNVRVIESDRGLTRQRNTILRNAGGFDVVVFFDDDFVADSNYLEAVEAAFLRDNTVAMITGRVIADGICGPGFDFEDAEKILAAKARDGASNAPATDVYNGYGCNMSVRLSAQRAGKLFFDERLPLYGWLEDVDFSRQLAAFGRIVKLEAAEGVHLGVKSGRQSGVRLGYSQIANPIYLARKQSCSWRKALHLMSRNIAANLSRSIRPEPYVDRLGRLTGNARACVDLATGKLNPIRAETL